MNRLAIKVVDALIEGFGPHRRIPVKVRRGDQTLDCEFTGYYQHPRRGHVASIGYPSPAGGFSHGMLNQDDILDTPVPSPEEWEAERLAAEQAAAANPPAKAAFWPTSGSGA